MRKPFPLPNDFPGVTRSRCERVGSLCLIQATDSRYVSDGTENSLSKYEY